MEQKVGISLCISGTATRIAGSRMCQIIPGMATIISPALPMVELESSADFQECTVLEQMNLVADETAPFFSQMMPLINESLPCIRLEESTVKHFVQSAGRISEREKRMPESPVFRQMNERLTSLMRLELILGVLYEIATGNRPVVEKPSRGEQVFVRFMQSLGRDFSKRRVVADYAEEAALSVRHFSTLIHQYSGRTPKQWITTFTISQAKSLLLQPGLSVKEIASRLGFPEQFTFRKYFKTNTGSSPTEYRKGTLR
ncbi:MAG: AraC family transcriptional regulator [Bacteroidales bacterium]|nr:AraC family transcriptional regulator [Bacteroidales bacterium]